MTELVIIGAGGHGAVVAEAAALSQTWSSIAFLDDNLSREEKVVGYAVLSTTSKLEELIALGRNYEFFVALGDNHTRQKMLSSIEEQGGVLAKIVHPNSVISPSACVGAGSVICAGAVISARADIARGCIVNNCASIDHDCVLGNAVHVSPGAHLAGSITVGDRSWIGIGASVKEGVNIGRDAVVGAGAAVVDDVPDSVVIAGVPARPLVRKAVQD
jgi:sugar O-acyltransferase (sialic acid O-acetyltransferase NeuD family)